VPALPSSVLEPVWVQVAALLPARQVHHPLGCHRPRIPARLVFHKLVHVLWSAAAARLELLPLADPTTPSALMPTGAGP
jgi:transposase